MNAPETRERSACGIRPALIVPAMMSSSISPIPEQNSATKRQPSTSQYGPPAAGTRINGAGKRKQPSTKVRPTPSRRAIRAVMNEPPSVPTEPAPSTSPSVAGRTCRLRVA